VFFACILLTIAVSGGLLLTFLYERRSCLSLRLSMGGCIGLALLATFGFVLSSLLGLTKMSLALSAWLLLLPVLLLARSETRDRVRNEFSAAIEWLTNRNVRPQILFYLVLTVILALTFSQNMVDLPDGIYTRLATNLGDLPFHLHAISSFVSGHNIPVEDPSYAGVRFTYPILADFLTAMPVSGGAPIAPAMWLQSMILSLSLVGLFHHWTRTLTRDRLAACLAPVLLIFSGGLGWWLLMQDLRLSDGSIITLLGHLPRDYTVANSTIFRWGNSLTTLLLPERSFLFGLSLAAFIFYQWWAAIDSTSNGASETTADSSTRRMLAAGICAGMLPLIHTHGFVVVVATGVCLAILFPQLWRAWLMFLITALLTGIPGMAWLSYHSAVDRRQFLAWHVGWDHASYNPLWFWFVNTGLFIPLLFAALLAHRSDFAIPRRLTLFYLPFLLWFIVPNFLQLSPWIWDNIKFMFYWYAASVPLVALLLARLGRQPGRRWVCAAVLASLTLSGALDIMRVITHAVPQLEFTSNGIQMARLIDLLAPPHAVVLHAPTWNSPVYLTGRRSLAGYSGWTWSRGLNSSQRETDIRKIYAGAPDAKNLVQKYHVDYVLIGPSERSLPVNPEYWKHCSKLSQIGEYQLYATDCNP
jgi:hypothetical protein